MKRFLIILGMLFCSVLPACAIIVTNQEMGYITVSATETAEVTPDTATINFAVETYDINSKVAADKNNQITEKAIKAIKQELASDEKAVVQTKNYNIKPNYKNQSDKIELKNYTVTNTIYVKTSDISKVSKIINIAMANNVTRIGSLNMYVDNVESYYKDLSECAIKKAKKNALQTAQALNQKLKGVKVIHVNVYQPGSNSVKCDALKMGTTTTPIETGKIKLSVSVNAEFYVK